MLSVKALILLLCIGTFTFADFNLTTQDNQFLVQEHNRLRIRAALGNDSQPQAADLCFMEWSDGAAKTAQVHANQCIFAHDNASARLFGNYTHVGQNIFVTSQNDSTPFASISWYDETFNYTFASKTCDVNAQCGHYTQLVSNYSVLVGCGMTWCNSVQNVSPLIHSIMVCNYEPAGNMNGYSPYTIGPPCSKCPAGYTQCYAGALCATVAQCATYNLTCTSISN